MRAWWTGLAARERMLIALAGGLSALVLVWQFVLVPALTARAEARTDLAASSQTLTRLQEAYMLRRAKGEIEFTIPGQAGISDTAFKTKVTRAASDAGLSLTRLQGGNNTAVGLVFERADPQLVFFWLEQVETRLGGRITRLTMEQVGDGMVRVSVNVEGNTG